MPLHIRRNPLLWIASVESDGLTETCKVPGYHDETLHGRRIGQQSIRLNRAWRAIYEVRGGEASFVSVEEISKHDYRSMR